MFGGRKRVNDALTGSVVAWGRGAPEPPIGKIVAIAANAPGCLGVLLDGTVRWIHRNPGNSLGVPDGLIGAVAVAVGHEHAVALRADGNVSAWCARPEMGMANVPPEARDVVSIAAGAHHSLALRRDGTVIAWGWADGDRPTWVPSNLANVKQISAGDDFNMALCQDGSVVAWGTSAEPIGPATGPMRMQRIANRRHVSTVAVDAVSIAAGTHGGIAVRSDGTVVAVWRRSDYFDPGDVMAVPMLSGVNAVEMSHGAGEHALALRRDGTVAAWGANEHGQTSPPAGLSDVVAIACGSLLSYALNGDGAVARWGWAYENSDGEADVPAGLSGVIAIAAGHHHSLALTSAGTVVAWGRNESGESTVPPDLADVVAIAAGGSGWPGAGYSLALRQNGTIVGWGEYNGAPVAVPGRLRGAVAIADGLVLLRNGRVIAWDLSDGSRTPVPKGITDAVAIASAPGWGHVALRGNGSVVSWDSQGEVDPTCETLSGVQTVAGGGRGLLAARRDGTVLALGRFNQAEVLPGLSDVTALAVGQEHKLALRRDGTVVGWDRDGGNVHNGAADVPAGLERVIAIAAGDAHSLALVQDDDIP